MISLKFYFTYHYNLDTLKYKKGTLRDLQLFGLSEFNWILALVHLGHSLGYENEINVIVVSVKTFKIVLFIRIYIV